MTQLVKKWAIYVAKESWKRSQKNAPIILKYCLHELAPPKPTDLGQIKNGFKDLFYKARTGKFLDTNMRDAFINSIVVLEVMGWFWVGEIIGKRHLVAYHIKY